ncbi:hypothetical protein FJZ21_01150 [Candidatus Pacearchaeota archaeon]|nr:hypothetical protein [Candidatus Pacearchaeota archaeon]
MKRKLSKTWIILISLIGLIFFLVILNIILREKMEIENYEQNIKNIFGENFIRDYNVKFYSKGIFQTFSSITVCNSIYLKNPSKLTDNSLKSLIIHESTHIYQNKEEGCVKNSLSSLYHQFKAFITKGSRGHAYLYSLDSESYNPEQEASIIEDYHYLKYLDGSKENILCTSCENYEKEEVIILLEEKYKKIVSQA